MIRGFDAPEGVKIFHSPEAASEAARVLDAAYVIGGAQVYEAFLALRGYDVHYK